MVKIKIIITIVRDVKLFLAEPVPLADGPLIFLRAQVLVLNSP